MSIHIHFHMHASCVALNFQSEAKLSAIFIACHAATYIGYYIYPITRPDSQAKCKRPLVSQAEVKCTRRLTLDISIFVDVIDSHRTNQIDTKTM